MAVKTIEYLKGVMVTVLKEVSAVQDEMNGGDLSQEQGQTLLAVYAFLVTIPNIALKAVAVYSPDIPERIDAQIRAIVVKCRIAIADYRAGRIEAQSLRATARECIREAAELRKQLTFRH